MGDTLSMLASLCDAMKRLERAIAADAPADREYHLGECAVRREAVERSILTEGGQ